MLMDLLLGLLSVLVFLECYDRVKRMLLPLFDRISLWFEIRKADLPDVEESEPEQFLSGTYDVKAFRNRIEELKNVKTDEDGLYDILEDTNPTTDFTGVEIITPSGELMLDRQIGG